MIAATLGPVFTVGLVAAVVLGVYAIAKQLIRYAISYRDRNRPPKDKELDKVVLQDL